MRKSTLGPSATRRRLRQLDKALAEVEHVDCFPGNPRVGTRSAYAALEAEVNRRFSSQEPATTERPITRLTRADYQGRTWATRRHLWIDRVASAWLISCHIDTDAYFLWRDSPADCPVDAHGLDFDGAAFTHVLHQGGEPSAGRPSPSLLGA